MLHCPYCGDALSRAPEGYLVCQNSGMGLSRELERRLTEVFLSEEREPSPSPFDTMDKWHCAGCGEKLAPNDDGLERCPSCRRTMGEFSYQLIEFHPHCSA